MMKKVVLLTMLLISFVLPTFSHADEVDSKGVKIDNFEISSPQNATTLTTDDAFIVTGTGLKNDKIFIQVKLIKRNGNGDVILNTVLDEYDFEVDSLKVFAQEIKLKNGENQIIVVLNRDGKKSYFYKTINYDKELNLTKDLKYKVGKK